MERVDYESLIVQELISSYNDERLDISPWYQRRSVWSTPQQSYLINTIFEKKPVPSIYIRHRIDIEKEESIREVVDGQQRIRAILDFRQNKFSARHNVLGKKIYYQNLSNHQRQDFLQTKLAVGYLIGADDKDVIDIFGRINSISKSLNPQEKRNARFSGDFKQFCLRQAAERLPFWRSTGLFTATDISRMLEVQFVSDLVINLMVGLSDYSAKTLDKFYSDFDENFPDEANITKRMERIFEIVTSVPPDAFRDTVFRASQVTFSLMLAIDNRPRPRANKVEETMRRLDERIQSFADQKEISAADTELVSGFKGGNLHRIRARRIRANALNEALK